MNIDFNTLEPGTHLKNEGGFYIERIKYPDGNIWALILAPKEADTYVHWKVKNTCTENTDSVFDGFSNSNNMNNSDHPAAWYCRKYRGGGHDDWFLPAKYELELVYRHLKPLDVFSTDTFGANPFAYPAPTKNYERDAGMTKNPLFRGGTANSQRLNIPWYWTSSQYQEKMAWVQYMLYGGQYTDSKTTRGWVRPVRKILIP